MRYFLILLLLIVGCQPNKIDVCYDLIVLNQSEFNNLYEAIEILDERDKDFGIQIQALQDTITILKESHD